MLRRKRSFLVTHHGYDFDVLVLIGSFTVEQMIAAALRHGQLSVDDAALLDASPLEQGRTVLLECGLTVMRIKHLSADVLAHEVFHAVEFLFRRLGIRLSEDSHEAYAYAIEGLTRSIARKVKKR